MRKYGIFKEVPLLVQSRFNLESPLSAQFATKMIKLKCLNVIV